MDVSSVLTALGLVGVGIGAIGACELSVRYGGKVWKWIAGAL